MSDGGAEFDRGHALVRQGDLDGAEAAFRRADEAGHPGAAGCLGLFAESRGDSAAAADAYRRADGRGDRLGAMRLGLLLAHDDDWEGAREAWARAEERPRSEPGERLEALLLGAPVHPVVEDASRRSPFTQPVLIGAVTVLVVVIGMYLAYISAVGLPFVPTRQLKVDIADGTDLVPGNDVLESGFRIGDVASMRAIRLPNGVPAAQLTLDLTPAHGKIPVDSKATILSRSVLGLKYVQLTIGHARRVFPDGGTLPIAQTSVPVRIDQVYDSYNAPTRAAIQQNLVGFGDALTGRGSALNDTFAALPSLLGSLRPVAQYLSDPRTGLTRFLGALNSFTSAVAPVAQTNVRLFADMATTFAAISHSRSDLESTISQSPSTLEVSTRSLRIQQPFLANFAVLGGRLQPATVALRETLPVLNPALEAGTRVLGRTPSLDVKLQGVMAALKTLAQAPGTGVAVNALTGTVDVLNPMIRYLGPYVTVCNDWNYWWTNLAGDLDEETSFGYAQRALINMANSMQPNNIGSIGATEPVNGGGTDSTTSGGNEYAHGPVYGAAIDNQGNADCETGQRGFPRQLNYFDPQHRLYDSDQHTPGDQGTTYTGALHVPKGETFTRNPQIGPQTPYNPEAP
jgi:virulence factor Mce-like protein